MQKLPLETQNLTQSNIDKIASLFPNTVTEMPDDKGGIKKGINFDILRQELSDEVIDTGEECYDFTWVGKKQSILEGNTPIRKTLRPCREESKDWENTENLYIEGDNLEVLKLLQESYLNSVKMIYIDPPYNTGKDFVYRDKRYIDRDEYVETTEQVDEEGNRLFQNTETNGRFHSDWCSMMYPRLKLARNLLIEDGVIFISIDDNEVKNLRKICDEVFGEENFIAQLIWNLKTGTQAGHFTRSHEYILCYTKAKIALANFSTNSSEHIIHGALKKISAVNPASVVEFPVGFEYEGNNAEFSGILGVSEQEFILNDKMVFENGKLKYPVKIKAGWAMKNQLISWINGEDTYDTKGQKVVKFYFNSKGILFYEKIKSIINPKTVIDNVGGTKKGSSEIISIFKTKIMDFPKSQKLIELLVNYVCDENSIILDFFSGSSTTAHAVMQLNAEDGGNRKHIMVQLPEETKEKSEAYKAGYKNICEIGKERIRRAGDMIVDKLKAEIEEEEKKKAKQITMDGISAEKEDDVLNSKSSILNSLDTGFRVLKVASTNMKDVYYSADEYNQTMIEMLESNIKEDRTDMDLLYQVLLDWGLPLSLKHHTETIDGVTVHTVDDGALIACFDDDVPESVVRELAKRKPLRVVFRDSSFADSPSKINVEEIFKLNAPGTSVRVI